MSHIPTYDFHIHTHYLKCANTTMEITPIVRTCEQLGITHIGITDHLNAFNECELHRYIRADIESVDTPLSVYFGVELNFLRPEGEFAFSQEIKEEYGFQFAIGGIHKTYTDTYDLTQIVDIQHRHHLLTCHDPLVDVLVHPYWFDKGPFDANGWPWFDEMPDVPERYVRELAQTAKETATAIEINAGANLTNPRFSEKYVQQYTDFLSIIAEEGVCFSLGSDAHDIARLKDIHTARKMAEYLQLTEDRIWHPIGQPLNGG